MWVYYSDTSLMRNSTPFQDHHKALGIVLLQGPRRKRFLMSEVPLYTGAYDLRGDTHDPTATTGVQGSL
jgi:hypothetical protein